ncbi:hypothetical protein N7461_008453 [Penicillium sp. DV-2018c]|nr:hypothetical protein N7461_008453 [Penicillium sp. DV-2018c]
MRIGSDTTTPLMKLDDLILAAQTEESDNIEEQPSSALVSRPRENSLRGQKSDKMTLVSRSSDEVTVKIPLCSHCGTMWHNKSEFWHLNPHLKPTQKRRRADPADNAHSMF